MTNRLPSPPAPSNNDMPGHWRSETSDVAVRARPRSVPGVWTDGREYEALIPPPIADLAPVGGFEDAEAALVELDAVVAAHSRRARLVESLLYAESLPSAQVMRLGQGLKVQLGRTPHQGMAAFRRAVTAGVARDRLDETALADLHRLLMPGRCAVHRRVCSGRLRQGVIWTRGGHPADAVYVAPPVDLLPDLLADLVAYLARDDVSPLEQAAVGYAQFEFIHPFGDGNGRVGRALMQIVPRRRGLVGTLVAPLGLRFFANMPDFFDAHRAWRDGDHHTWCRYVACGATDSARNLLGLVEAGQLT